MVKAVFLDWEKLNIEKADGAGARMRQSSFLLILGEKPVCKYLILF